MNNTLHFLVLTAVMTVEVYKALRITGTAMIVCGVLLITVGLIVRGKARKAARIQPDEEDITELNEKPDVSIYVESVIGDRKYQQDYFLFAQGSENEESVWAGRLAVVCDGMGGIKGGELASRCCAETIFNGFYQIGWTENVRQILHQLVTAADKEVSGITSADGKPLNCGTTAIAVVIRDNKAYWVSTGDSRIYYFHNGNLQQLTRDHNFRMTLQERCTAGLITQEQVENNRQKEALISYVGKGGNLIIDTGEFDFPQSRGDILLLCSDGLYKSIPDSEIQRLIARNADNVSQLPGILVRAAMAGGRPGKHDNTTVLAIG